jgi:hypothetical protein
MKYKLIPVAKEPRTALNLTRVVADGAGDAFISGEQFWRLGTANMGIQIQAVGCTITPSFTLFPQKEALSEDPLIQGNVPWAVQPAVSSGNMHLYPLATTALKLSFSGEGEAIVVSW